MEKLVFCLTVLLLTIGGFEVAARIDDVDVHVLRSMYQCLNRPRQLTGWMEGDPCDDFWIGITCIGSSVISLQLPGLGLSGNIEVQLYKLRNLERLDMSSNGIHGEIPPRFPINITHLNLSNNQLSGVLGDFYGLDHLRNLDLSWNQFTGDLPRSFRSLTNLSRLYLQGNVFTGSVEHLAMLPLSDLNIQDNNFTGFVPKELYTINNLCLSGNRFNSEIYPTERRVGYLSKLALRSLQRHGFKRRILASGSERWDWNLSYSSVAGIVTDITCLLLVYELYRWFTRYNLSNLKLAMEISCKTIPRWESTLNVKTVKLRNGRGLAQFNEFNGGYFVDSKEFKYIVKKLKEMKHNNLQKLLGSSHEPGICRFIYPYNVCFWLPAALGQGVPQVFLSDTQRIGIALGVGQALSYLHEKGIFGYISRECIMLGKEASPILVGYEHAFFKGNGIPNGKAKDMEEYYGISRVLLRVREGHEETDGNILCQSVVRRMIKLFLVRVRESVSFGGTYDAFRSAIKELEKLHLVHTLPRGGFIPCVYA